MDAADELARTRLELATLRQAIDAHAMTISFDAQARVSAVNDAFCRLAGRSRDELLGRPFRLLESDNQPHEVMLAIQRSVAEGQVWQGQIEGASRGGRPYWLEVTVVPFRSGAQRLADTIALCTDVTATRRLADRFAHSEAQYRTLVDSLSEVVLRTDDLGMITFVNAAWEGFSGVAADQARGRSLLDFVHPDDHEGCVLDFDDLLHQGRSACVSELRLVTPDGRERWMEAHLQRLAGEDGLAAGVVGTLTDITERHQASQAMLQAKDAAEAASRLKSAFLANMSHEVRTPLNGMIGMTDLVLATPGLDAQQRQYLQVARASAESLMALFDNILHYADLEAGRVAVTQVPFELKPLLAQCLQGIAAGAQAQGLALRLELDDDLPELALGDPARLRLVLARLLDNALKFTRLGHIALIARPGEAPGELLITVSDSGIGIPRELQTHIFEPFVQQDGSSTRRFGGTGLGLSITHRLVQMMGGRIHLRSEPGQGTDLELSLPIAPVVASAAAPAAGAGATPAAAPQRREASAAVLAGARQAYADGLRRADPETLDLIAGPFADQAPRDLAALREALRTDDRAALLRQAHAMKGLLLTFEAQRAADVAATLQDLAEAPGAVAVDLAATLDALAAELDLLLPLLRLHAQAVAAR